MRTEEEALAAYHRACDFDARGDEAAAIPEYERSLALGLPAVERKGALLGLGSSLRNVGRAVDAVEVLKAAVVEFPQDAPLRAFHALALYSSGAAREAMVTLLDLALKHAPIGKYTRVLGEYRDRLAHPPSDDIESQAASLTRIEFVRAFDFPFLVGVGPRPAGLDEFDVDTEVGRRADEAEEPSAGPPVIIALKKASPAVPSAVSLGRAPTNDVVVRDACISKVHAFFRVSEGRCELRDGGSRNGTWVGHRKLEPHAEAVPIKSGDVITFGRLAFYYLSAGALWDRLRKR